MKVPSRGAAKSMKGYNDDDKEERREQKMNLHIYHRHQEVRESKS